MKILAIDGNSIINRAFYGIKLLTTKNGQYTNGIYGFMNILNRLCERETPDGVVIAFDLKAPTFRHKMYDGYKAGRKPMPEELRSQMPLLKKLLTLYGYHCIELEGYEADDILGTMASLCEKSGNECVIATGDRDSFQLVSASTRVLLSATKTGRPEITEYTPQLIKEKYGVKPCGMIEIKALQGDASDNIPGVAGVGEKTAGELIAKYGNIDNIYDNIDELDIKESLKAKLMLGKESAYLSRKLGTIYREVPINGDLEVYITSKRDDKELSIMLTELEFYSFLEGLGLKASHRAAEPENEYTEVESEALVKAAEDEKQVDIILTENGFIAAAKALCGRLSENDAVRLLTDKEVKIKAYDLKKIYKYAIRRGFSVNAEAFDCTLAAYILNPSSSDYELLHLAADLGVSVNKSEGVYAAALLKEINSALSVKLRENGGEKLLYEIELPLCRVLAEMEEEGFLVDREAIARYGEVLQKRIEQLEAGIYEAVGEKFNINSPRQLGAALFETLGLPCKKKTKSGYSTNADVLEGLRPYHPIIDIILEYRTLTKLKSTYCDGLAGIDTPDGRIRSTLNQTETRTGRISSSEPNLQNIPVRRAEGRELRRFFTAKEGFVLCDADYSQIELRVLSHIAGDETMINAFKNGVDIHTVTASEVFKMPKEMVTPLMRSRAKAVNFGIVYGIGAFSLAKDIGVSNREAAEYIKGYLTTYRKVDEYMKRTVEKAKEQGYAETLFGRRRLLPELSNSNGMLRAFGERVARNMPIQGTAADIIKIAMIRVHDRLLAEMPEAKLIMQVHDELIVEAPESKAEEACRILKEEMENAVILSVPLTVDAHYGKTWYDAKG